MATRLEVPRNDMNKARKIKGCGQGLGLSLSLQFDHSDWLAPPGDDS